MSCSSECQPACLDSLGAPLCCRSVWLISESSSAYCSTVPPAERQSAGFRVSLPPLIVAAGFGPDCTQLFPLSTPLQLLSCSSSLDRTEPISDSFSASLMQGSSYFPRSGAFLSTCLRFVSRFASGRPLLDRVSQLLYCFASGKLQSSAPSD